MLLEVLFFIEFFIVSGIFFMIMFSVFKRRHLGKKKDEFVCLQCGRCCVLKVKPKPHEIERIVNCYIPSYVRNPYWNHWWLHWLSICYHIPHRAYSYSDLFCFFDCFVFYFTPDRKINKNNRDRYDCGTYAI